MILLTIDYGSTGVGSILIRLLEAAALFTLGRWIADRRLRQLNPA